MPTFDIVRQSDIDNTFRVAKVMNDFDVKPEHSTEEFHGKIDFPKDWQIGIIVGGSGTGKSTIGRELFGELIDDSFEYKAKSVIDDMPGKDIQEIQKIFYAVGFGSVPSWLKPYSVLSNGEKMRVDLARKMLNSDFVVFDEFTSVVDRQVAKVMSIAINKAISRYPDKKFVAIGCHFDVIEFLQPDWIFNTDKMQQVFQFSHEASSDTPSEDASGQSGGNLNVIII